MTSDASRPTSWLSPRELLAFVLIAAALAGGALCDGVPRIILLAAGLIGGALVPYAGLLIIALTLWTLPLIEMPAIVSDIRVDELLLAAVGLGVLVRALMRRDWKPSSVERAFAVFLAALVLSVGVSRVLGSDMPLRALAVPVLRHAARLLLFAVTTYLLEGRSARSAALVAAMTTGALLAAVLGIVQYHSVPVHEWVVATFPTLDGASTYPYTPGGLGYRSMSTFDGNPNRFGVAMAIMALFATVMATRARGRRPALAWGLVAIVLLTSLLFTTSRSAFLAAAVMLLFAAAFLRAKAPLLVLVGWVAVALAVPNLMLVRVLDLLGRPTATGTVPDPSVSGRVEAIVDGTVETASNVLPTYDNFYVDVFRNYGPIAVLGLAVLIVVVTLSLLRATRSAGEQRWFAAAALLGWGVILLVSLTGSFFSIARVSEIVWILVALGLMTDASTDMHASTQGESSPT